MINPTVEEYNIAKEKTLSLFSGVQPIIDLIAGIDTENKGRKQLVIGAETITADDGEEISFYLVPDTVDSEPDWIITLFSPLECEDEWVAFDGGFKGIIENSISAGADFITEKWAKFAVELARELHDKTAGWGYGGSYVSPDTVIHTFGSPQGSLSIELNRPS